MPERPNVYLLNIRNLRIELSKLSGFLSKSFFTSEDISNWVSNCVALFSSIGVSEAIISGFMRSFEKTEEVGPMYEQYLGPFYKNFGSDSFRLCSDARRIFVDIAFKTAETIIENIEESQKLVPKILIGYFEDRQKYAHIYSMLCLLEDNFIKKDSQGLARNSMTLLQSVFDLEESLQSSDLSKKIRKLLSEKELRLKFGISSEILVALDNSRIIRNFDTHRNLPMELNVPLAVALGSAFLVILVLQITMATGVYIVE